MLNDIYAMEMAGTYETREGDTVIERGTWRYSGHGSAEITMTANSERPEEGIAFSLEIHSAERQLDGIALDMWEMRATDRRMQIRVLIAGHQLDIAFTDSDGVRHQGVLSFPEETVFMGPSPIWMVHLMLTAPIPTDRSITTPYVALGLHGEDIEGGFYRLTRVGNTISIGVLDADGKELIPADIGNGVPGLEVIVTDDQVPATIRAGRYVTELVRIPEPLHA